MNLSQLQAELQAHGYGSDTAAQQIIFLNDAYRYVCGLERWPFLEKQDSSLTLTLGTNVVAYTGTLTDLVEFDAVRLTDGLGVPYDLENVEPQTMRSYEVMDNTTRSTPQYWSIIANQLHFWPYADQAYTLNIDYIFQPVDLANPTDIPALPPQFHDVIVWGAARTIARRQRDLYSEQIADAEFTQRVKAMSSAFKLRQRQTSSKVKKSGYWQPRRRFPWTIW